MVDRQNYRAVADQQTALIAVVMAIVLLCGCGQSTEATIEPPVVIPAGTRLVVRTVSTVSTKSASAGTPFRATLHEPFAQGDRVIAPKGAEVDGLVVHSDAGGRVKGRASIAVQLTRIQAADGRPIPVKTNSVWRTAKGTKRKDALVVGGASGLGAAIGAIAGGGKGAAIGAGAGAGAGAGGVLLTRGAPAVIGAESILSFTLRDPVAAP